MASQIKSKKIVKKSFYEVKAPFTSTKIQIYSESPEKLDGKTIKLDLTRDLKGKSLELKLRIKNENNTPNAHPEEIILLNSYIRKVMRKSTDYAEDSFITESKEGRVQVKPLLVTRRRVSRAVLKALRTEAKKLLETYIKTRTSHELFSDIITNKLQKHLSQKLKKIYPLSMCEIRIFKIKKDKE